MVRRTVWVGTLLRDLFRTSIFGCILVDFWHPLAPKWHPNGSQKTLLAPSVCILLASFSEHRLLDAFWSPFGSLLAIYALTPPQRHTSHGVGGIAKRKQFRALGPLLVTRDASMTHGRFWIDFGKILDGFSKIRG